MIAASERDKMTSDERHAWLDALSDDDRAVVYTPPGYLCDLVAISQLKRALATDGQTVADRLATLESLNDLANAYLTADAVAAVQPACDTAVQMIQEAVTLDPAQWRVMGSFDVFSAFAKLNPSLVTAVKICNRNWSRPADSKTQEMVRA